MPLPPLDNINTVAVIGCGSIGAGWAAQFLLKGIKVKAYDPDRDREHALRATLDRALDLLATDPDIAAQAQNSLTFCASMLEAIQGAQFVQECVPERLDLKHATLAEIDALCSPDIVVASSTSGITASRLQSACAQPSRLVVGHPFHPVYLVPLVEVVGGALTNPVVLDWSMAFYRQIGKSPLLCRGEIQGHIANRLQTAVAEEALRLIDAGIASTADIDQAVTDGPGFRWSTIGPMLTWHLASSKGIEAVMEGEFGFSLDEIDCLSHTDGGKSLTEKVVQSSKQQVAGQSRAQLEDQRDRFLAKLLTLRQD
ncbi:MAG: 3-hydroxyacyl-CoA dehydrogenase NAD-binding domain-containing protein [Pseudomonadota bacterium]